MSDLIRIVDLEVMTHIGVPDEERATPQKLLISAELLVNEFTPAASQDDVSLTVNYFEVTQSIVKICKKRPRKLLETLVTDLAQAILTEYTIQLVKIEVKKMIIPEIKYVSVQIERDATWVHSTFPPDDE